MSTFLCADLRWPIAGWLSLLIGTLLPCCALAQTAGYAQTRNVAPASESIALARYQPQAPEPEAEEEAPPEDEIPELPPTTVETTPAPQAPPEPVSFPNNPLNETTVLTPTRTEASLSTVGSSVTVLSRENIERTQQPLLLEVLRGQLGLDVVQSGGPGRATSVFIRGAESDHTKVLLDGLPLNDPLFRRFDFGQLTTDNLERVEILRGPQSTLYGSDAIGGVISLTTRRGEGPAKLRFSSTAGAFDTTTQQVNLSGSSGNVYYSVGSSYQDSDGFSVLQTNVDRDGYHIGAVSSRIGWAPTDNFDVDFVLRYNDSNVDIDPFVDGPGANLFEQTFARLQFRAENLDGAWENKVGLSYNNSLLLDTSPGSFNPRSAADFVRIDWQSNLDMTENNTFTVGIDAQEEQGQTSTVGQRSLENAGVYVQDQAAFFDRIFLTLGGRWDDYSQAGPAQTYRATVRANAPETGTSFHASIGTGFRAPSLLDLFGFGGNPNLRPEESKGWDYGVDQSLFGDSVLLGVTYFRNDFTNLIDFDPVSFVLFNVDEALATGIEVSGAAQVDEDTTVGVFYTHTDTRDEATGLPLLRRARDRVAVNINRQLLDGRASVNCFVLFVGNRIDVGNVPLDPYTTVNINGSYRLTDQVELFARIDNLFNEKYEEVSGFNVAPASFYGGVSLSSW